MIVILSGLIFDEEKQNLAIFHAKAESNWIFAQQIARRDVVNTGSNILRQF